MSNKAKFTKIVRMGRVLPYEGATEYLNVYAKIKYQDKKLSISGVAGPMPNGDCKGSCGQIDMSYSKVPEDQWEFAPGWNFETLSRFWEVWGIYHLNDCSPFSSAMKDAGWDKLAQKTIYKHIFTLTVQTIDKQNSIKKNALLSLQKGETVFFDEHTRDIFSLPYEKVVYNYSSELMTPPEHYENKKNYRGTRTQEKYSIPPEAKSLGIIRPSDHSDGMLGRPFDDSGEFYGGKHSFLEVPDDVLDFLRNLPNSDKKPAWV